MNDSQVKFLEIAASLNNTIGPLRRAIVRATRTRIDLPDLTEAQVEVLRSLQTSKTASPGELAVNLRLARSTVSNLLRSMAESKLIERQTAEDDKRSVKIKMTKYATEILYKYDNESTQIVSEALANLSIEENNATYQLTSVLQHLTESLEQLTAGQSAEIQEQNR